MAAKESWVGGDIAGARAILGRAFEANPDSEGIWLAAVKLEAENGEIDAARELMKRAREVAGTDRVSTVGHIPLKSALLIIGLAPCQIWMKSAVFERSHGTNESALTMVKSGLKEFPKAEKLHLIHAQLLLAQSPPNKQGAREALASAVKKCPTSVALWLMSSRLEESIGVRIKSRALLEKARSLNPKSEEIWLESVKVEERDESGAAKGMLARGE